MNLSRRYIVLGKFSAVILSIGENRPQYRSKAPMKHNNHEIARSEMECSVWNIDTNATIHQITGSL